ncbi:MAG TPA: aquaporin [Candidatus Micrarchaeia archaeon]|nr:aquaporin [Candidatus Micrarchaeia archaeon]
MTADTLGATRTTGRRGGPERRGHRSALLAAEPPWVTAFDDASLEWRRLFSEALGTFFLVLAGAGGGVVAAVSHGAIGRAAAVTAPGLTVMAVILFMGTVSGAHLNPVVSLAFALRREFPWRRLPGYVAVQLAGATLACLVLAALFGRVGLLGSTLPGPGINDVQAMVVEGLLTLGLVSTILGTAAGAQNVGPLSAIAVGGYIALAGLWSSPISGASMNPARSLGPDLVRLEFSHVWLYVVGPALGALAAVGGALILRGPGGDATAARAAQGTLGGIVAAAAAHGRQVVGGGASAGGDAEPGGSAEDAAPSACPPPSVVRPGGPETPPPPTSSAP